MQNPMLRILEGVKGRRGINGEDKKGVMVRGRGLRRSAAEAMLTSG